MASPELIDVLVDLVVVLEVIVLFDTPVGLVDLRRSAVSPDVTGPL